MLSPAPGAASLGCSHRLSISAQAPFAWVLCFGAEDGGQGRGWDVAPAPPQAIGRVWRPQPRPGSLFQDKREEFPTHQKVVKEQWEALWIFG